jgi:hypothetical protein
MLLCPSHPVVGTAHVTGLIKASVKSERYVLWATHSQLEHWDACMLYACLLSAHHNQKREPRCKDCSR